MGIWHTLSGQSEKHKARIARTELRKAMLEKVSQRRLPDGPRRNELYRYLYEHQDDDYSFQHMLESAIAYEKMNKKNIAETYKESVEREKMNLNDPSYRQAKHEANLKEEERRRILDERDNLKSEQSQAVSAVVFAREDLAYLDKEYKKWQRNKTNRDELMRILEKTIEAKFELQQAEERFQNAGKALKNLDSQ